MNIQNMLSSRLYSRSQSVNGLLTVNPLEDFPSHAHTLEEDVNVLDAWHDRHMDATWLIYRDYCITTCCYYYCHHCCCLSYYLYPLQLCFVQKTSSDFEIAVVGAGPAGATCAYFLSMLMLVSIMLSVLLTLLAWYAAWSM